MPKLVLLPFAGLLLLFAVAVGVHMPAIDHVANAGVTEFEGKIDALEEGIDEEFRELEAHIESQRLTIEFLEEESRKYAQIARKQAAINKRTSAEIDALTADLEALNADLSKLSRKGGILRNHAATLSRLEDADKALDARVGKVEVDVEKTWNRAEHAHQLGHRALGELVH